MRTLRVLVAASSTAMALPAAAQGSDEDLAKQLSNPVAALISVPIQVNHDHGYGADRNGHKTYVNIQPVVPFQLDRDWNLISRTILPIVDQHDVVSGTRQSGIGDVTQSFFFSPARPTPRGSSGAPDLPSSCRPAAPTG